VTGNKGRNFSGYVLGQYDDKKIQDLQDKYQAKINDPKFKQVYGQIEAFPDYAYQSPTGQAVMIKTMEEFVNAPLLGKSEKVRNTTAITKDRQQFAKEQQARSIAASLARLRESIAAGRIPWMNATATASYVINADNTVGAGNPVDFDANKFETITGAKPSNNSQLRSDGNGGYLYGYKDAEGNFVERGKVDPVTAQDRMTKEAAKTKVPNPALTPQKQPVRLPKDIKQTRIDTKNKPSWAN
jgi:hypothetical protein